MKKTQFLLAVFLFLFSFNVQAQKMPCLVVTTNFDTLYGIFIKADSELTIIQTIDRQKIMLKPEAVYEYALLQADGTAISYQFIKHPLSGEHKSMRRLVDGYYKLFLDKEPSRSLVNPALPKNSPVQPLASVYYLATHREDAVKISHKSWATILKKRLADCATVVESIDRKQFKFKDLPAIVASYNAYVRQAIANERKVKVDSIILER